MSNLDVHRIGDELTAKERRHRPEPVRITFADLTTIGALPPAAAGRVVPLEAAMSGDEQVFAARAVGSTAETVLDLDPLAAIPSVHSIVASTEARARIELPSVRELLLVNVLPVRLPDRETFRNLPNLEVLAALRATGEPRLDVAALASSLKEIAVGRHVLASHGQRDALATLRPLAGLERVVVKGCHPTDSVAPLAGMTSLRSVWTDAPGGWGKLGRLTSLESVAAEDARIADLRSMVGWAHVRSLWLSGGRIERIDGVERMPALACLDLRFVRVDDLAPLAGLPELARLRLVCLTDLHGLSPLGRLPALRELEIAGAHERTRRMHLTSLAGLRGSAALEHLSIRYTAFDDPDLSVLAELPGLRRVDLPADVEQQANLLRVSRPDIEVHVDSQSDDARSPVQVGRVLVHAPVSGHDGWWIFEDLSAVLSTPTNPDAEDVLRRALRARAPALERRLEFDTEAGAVGIRGSLKADIVKAAAVIDALARER